MNAFNDQEYLIKIQKVKFRHLLPPILIVIISFLLFTLLKLDWIKYLSFIGLIWYFAVFASFRLDKTFPPFGDDIFVHSPLSGRVKILDKNNLIIKKSFFDSIDVRSIDPEHDVQTGWSRKPIYFENNCPIDGNLIGYIWGCVSCRITLGEGYEIVVKNREKIRSGETIIKKV
jgi:hypothetical protein